MKVLKKKISLYLYSRQLLIKLFLGLACGRPIRGNVAFLGGPLNYLSELRNRFIQTLNLSDEQIIVPEEAHLLVAKGAALTSIQNKSITAESLLQKIENFKNFNDDSSKPLNPLFSSKEEFDEFKSRHSQSAITKIPLSTYEGDCFLGIDAGSSTSKIVLIDNSGNLLYSLYDSNKGEPLQSIINMLNELYLNLPKAAIIKYAGITGYGEKLIQTALNIDLGEVETIAHYTAAKKFMPDVTSIIDIGGQDMKYIKIKNNAIDNIMLNEACSSGCGSFIQLLADSLNISISDFVNSALKSRSPVDLGSRCTVFMNSKIKQAQKEGASVGDISAGLSFSVVKNALQKVMKIRDVNSLGNSIIVQGGTFYNDAILRAFELTVGKNVVRPDIAGLMGAYGIALLAIQQYETQKNTEYVSTILKQDQLKNLKIDLTHARCKQCENNCLLTINKFNNDKKFISGNRCERGSGTVSGNKDLPNLYKYKYERMFNYTSLDEDNATRGTIGIPRVLNMFEDYPFWFTFFTSLGFRVVLSDKSTKKIYEKGMESMPSESVCYPAKLTHGHIMDLIEKGCDAIFYPCIPYSRKEIKNTDNHYNCPIVISYSEVIKNNAEHIDKINFINSFLPFKSEKLVQRIMEISEFDKYSFSKEELSKAAKEAEIEYKRAKSDIRKKGEETIEYINKNNIKGIVLSGRPYHVDPEINHGIDTLITSLGLAVLTEDSISHLGKVKHPLRVMDQWTYHSRLYAAAEVVGMHDNLELVQLNSFGCGVDAVTTDQVEEILSNYGKMYTLIKIDEINNLGAVRIRIRSLLASMEKRVGSSALSRPDTCGQAPLHHPYEFHKTKFTKDMNKNNYTILMPQMAPIHFELMVEAIKSSGYNIELLRECTNNTVSTGLKYVNNDSCYPSIITTGQIIEALKSGKYDPDKTAVIMSQTGGGCRATNYIGFIRKALKDAGFAQVPVISFNIVGLEKSSGFKLSLGMLLKLVKSVIYGDLLQKLVNKNKAYEKNKGETESLYNEWMNKCKELIMSSSYKKFKKSIYAIVNDFEEIEFDKSLKKPRVGIVGEILIKYHPFGNNYIEKFLDKEGAEVVMPDFMGFIKYIVANKVISNSLLKQSNLKSNISKIGINLINKVEKDVKIALSNSNKGYLLPSNIWHLQEQAEKILSSGNQTGEGWFLTAEMIEYIENDIPNIVCVQPFACLPNHIVGKGVIKTIRNLYPNANIVPIDYDPGSSSSNQINRIKLLLTVANDNLKLKDRTMVRILLENEKTKEIVKI